jgi:hypothetical protein
MTLDLKKGMKIKKGELLSEIYKINFNRRKSSMLFSLLQQSGYIKISGKVIYVKKDINLR